MTIKSESPLLGIDSHPLTMEDNKNEMKEGNGGKADDDPFGGETDDPFQVRKGKTLTWSNVHMTVKILSGNKCCSGRNREEGRPNDDVKIILDNVWGSGAGNEITAILGPSGAGKTSVLGVLAGRIGNDKKCRVTADIRLDGVSVHPAEDMTVRREIAFVEQRDTLHCAATVRESILFSAKLRLPASTTDHQLEQLTNTMIVELGLTSCSDTVIGGEMLKKGVSGGERKRAAVGVELVTKPAIVFLDEPTSGLDSFSAMQVIQVLKKVAQSGASVLFSIHQPASDIFDTFDRLILMNKGRVMYQGTGEGVTDYFAARHHPLPARYNPADWIMIVAQTVPVKELEEAGYFPKTIEEAEGDISQDEPTEQPSVEGSSALHSQQHETEEKSSSVGMKKAADGRRVSTTTQISWLVKREWKSLYRNKMILGARLMLSLFMSILIGIIFWQVGGNDSYDFVNVQSHFGAVMIVLIMAMFSTALPTLIVFPEERPVFLREFSTNHYSVVSYFFSRLALEAFLTAVQVLVAAFLTYFMIDFQLRFFWNFIILYALAMSTTAIAMVIGSSVTDPKLAIEFLPMTLVPQIMFAGFFIAPDLIPVWLRWLQYLMPLTYATRLYLEKEFGRDCGSVRGNTNCQTILDSVGIESDDVWWYWVALLSLFVGLRLLALLLLRKKASKY